LHISKRSAISRTIITAITVVVIAISAIGVYAVLGTGGVRTTSVSTSRSNSQSGTTFSIPSSTFVSSNEVASSSSPTTQKEFLVSCGGIVWSTYHCDNTRDGVDANESTINQPRVRWQSSSLDGDVYAEPLAAFGTIYVATENDSVYALNDTTGDVVWRTHVGTPVTSGLPCGDINPLGITGTPVLDPFSKILYLVAEESEGHHYLYGLNSASGTIVFSKDIDPPGSVPIDQQQRSALALDNGVVYVEFGGLDGDCANYHGWVVGTQVNSSGNSSNLYTFKVAPNGSDYQGGIWEVGGALIGSNGNLFIATGNSKGGIGQTYDYGDGVVELSPTLQVISYFTPSNYVALNQEDLDIGSTGPILIGNQNLLFQVGKQGVGYLLNETNLGGVGGALYSGHVCNGGYGADAFYDQYVFVPCTNGLFAMSLQNLTTGHPSFSKSWSTSSFLSGAPIVSGNAVWTIDVDNGTLFALNITSGAMLFSYNLGSVVHFETPASSEGMIFACANEKVIAVSIST
jgi:outer membrane protein assembly factor BamB